ncbi:MAG: mRNA splicing protein [Marteilia pararefringens]
MSGRKKTVSEEKTREKERMEVRDNDIKFGPLSFIRDVLKQEVPVIISLRNNKKCICYIRAFDRHCNIIATDIQEVTVKNCKYTIDRKIPKAFLRGDQIITISCDSKIDENLDNADMGDLSAIGDGEKPYPKVSKLDS